MYLPSFKDYKVALYWQRFGTILSIEGNENVIDGIDRPAALQYKEANTPYHTLDGKQLSLPQRGLNIIRQGNGIVKKVMVK